MRARRGFTAACRHYNLVAVTQPCELSPESGETALHTLLDHQPDITAVIVWNDTATLGVIQAARQRGLRIPADLSLICSDYLAISNLISLKPTIFDIRGEEVAAQAAQLIIVLLEGELPSEQLQVLVRPTFIVGDSTAPPF